MTQFGPSIEPITSQPPSGGDKVKLRLSCLMFQKLHLLFMYSTFFAPYLFPLELRNNLQSY